MSAVAAEVVRALESAAIASVTPAVVSLGAAGFENTRHRKALGANNVFDRDPPYANYAASANNFVGGYDLAYGDPRGRFVYASIGYTLQ
jgi:iron complex outermembrane receptor protein